MGRSCRDRHLASTVRGGGAFAAELFSLPLPPCRRSPLPRVHIRSCQRRLHSPTGFDFGPQDVARYLGNSARAGLINIAGGCCGNTPEHIAAIAKALEGQPPRKWRATLTEESFAHQIESRA